MASTTAPDSELRWWGSDIAEISVDVLQLSQDQKRSLGVPSACDGASTPLAIGSLCCLLGVIIPIVILCTGSLLVSHVSTDAGNVLTIALPVAAAVLAASACCTCCFSIRRTCFEGIFSGGVPAPLVPPLCSQVGSCKIPVRRVLLVYNPNSGKRLAGDVLNSIVLPGLQAQGVHCETAATDRRGHAIEIAKTIDLKDFDAMVTLGGDGTFHELVNGLLAREDKKRIPVGFIPLGSGNGLAATLRQNMKRHGTEIPVYHELPAVLRWSLDRIANGRVSPVDLLQVEVCERRVASVMQVYLGMLAETDILAEPLRWMGPARLELVPFWSIVRKSSKSFKCRITRPDGSSFETTYSAIGASVGLAQHFDDKLRSAPSAQLDDGLAEFGIISPDASVDALLTGFMKLPAGAHTDDESTWFSQQITSLELEFEGPGVFNVDGEILSHDGRLRFKVLHRHLDMLVGEEEYATAAPASRAEAVPWQPYGRRWGMLAIFCVLNMSSQAIWIGFAPIQKDVMNITGESATWVNMLSLVFMIVYLPVNFPASYLMDVYGCRASLLLGASLNLVGAILRTVQTPGPGLPAALLMTGQVLCALGQPFITNMPPKLAGTWFPAYQRAMADTIGSLSCTVGAAVGFVLPTALGLNNMLRFHLAWAGAAWLLVLACFGQKPPVPPSPKAERSHMADQFTSELLAALGNGRLRCLLVAFSCALGSFNCLSTLSSELTRPFGFSSDDASNLGVFVVGFGILGALVMSIIVKYTERYKPVLLACLLCCVIFGALAIVTVKFIGATRLGTSLLYAAFAGLGWGATPVMPVSFEAAVEVGYPAGEGTLAGLCMSGGQALGVVLTAVVSALVQSGQPVAAWAISLLLFVIGLCAVLMFEQTSGFDLEYERLPDSSPVRHGNEAEC